jgi:hypothetical protein
MRYLVAYAAYAIGVAGLLVYLVPPTAPATPPAPRLHAEDELATVTLSVIDAGDYFSQRCTVKVSELAADMVVLNTKEEFDRLREQMGC